MDSYNDNTPPVTTPATPAPTQASVDSQKNLDMPTPVDPRATAQPRLTRNTRDGKPDRYIHDSEEGAGDGE
jgi:hypothetical protein